MNAIQTVNLSKSYGGWGNQKRGLALTGLSLDVREGEIFGFLGPNGAGKTTSIQLILNLIQPTSGSVEIFGRPATEAAVHRRIGYLPESVNLHTYYRGRSLLNFYADLCGAPKAGRKERIEALLRLVKLQDAGDLSIAKYSKGMLQRLGFAQALIHNPDLLILDEPTSNLDPVGRKEFRDVLVDLKQQGKTVFISSHVLSEVETVCDRVAILQQGVLKRVGTLQELSAPKSTRLVLAALPSTLIEAITSRGAQVAFEQGLVLIKASGEAMRLEVERVLAEAAVPILRTEVESQSLEDIFFSTIQPEPPPL